jgi:hypothetical protein
MNLGPEGSPVSPISGEIDLSSTFELSEPSPDDPLAKMMPEEASDIRAVAQLTWVEPTDVVRSNIEQHPLTED